MILDSDELYIYVGIATLAAGAAVAFGLGIGLMVLGASLIALGIFRMLAPDEVEPQAGSSESLAMTLVQTGGEE